MNPDELQKILRRHGMWLRGEVGGARANLREADLREADLSEADLRGADLRLANLSGANLSGANLSGAIDGAVCRMEFGGWSICVRATHTSIGCRQYANEAWLAWSPDEVAHMHADARDWWAVHGEAVKTAIRCVMSKAAKEKEAA